MQKPLVEFRQVSKLFHIPHEIDLTFREFLFGLHKRKDYESLWALKKLTFQIEKGEFVSFVGANGSGKTTLLRLISRVYPPTQGQVIVRGTTAPFLELVVGFQQELSVEDNIYLYGVLLGLSRSMVRARFQEIILFAGLKQFVDQRVKNLSTGMQARLAFSIAANVDADILIVDEVLAVGDKEFQRKCFELFERFKRLGKTIVFVSHDMDIVRRFSDRVIWLHEGTIVDMGDPATIIARYTQL
jgi:lipopolysaccharide transport system ATP-binding protein